jgi:hypothetical protein
MHFESEINRRCKCLNATQPRAGLPRPQLRNYVTHAVGLFTVGFLDAITLRNKLQILKEKCRKLFLLDSTLNCRTDLIFISSVQCNQNEVNADERGGMFLRNICIDLQHFSVSQPRSFQCEHSPPGKPQFNTQDLL